MLHERNVSVEINQCLGHYDWHAGWPGGEELTVGSATPSLILL